MLGLPAQGRGIDQPSGPRKAGRRRRLVKSTPNKRRHGRAWRASEKSRRGEKRIPGGSLWETIEREAQVNRPMVWAPPRGKRAAEELEGQGGAESGAP